MDSASQYKRQIASTTPINTGVIVHDATPERQQRPAWLHHLWQYLMHHLLRSHEPRIWQKLNSAGEVVYHAYDPHTGHTIQYATENELRAWLDQLPYCR